MARSRDFDLYFAVSACRDYLRRGVAPDLAASIAATSRDVPVTEVERLALEAHRECERARQDRRYWQSHDGRAALHDSWN